MDPKGPRRLEVVGDVVVSVGCVTAVVAVGADAVVDVVGVHAVGWGSGGGTMRPLALRNVES